MPTIGAYQAAVEELRRNGQQWQAFESKGNCVTLAGPGSGKTKLLTTKLARLVLEDVRRPRGVACLTYNNECVNELERRLARLGIADRPNVFVGTLHRFCRRYVLQPLSAVIGLPVPQPIRVASQALQRTLFSRAVDEVGVVAEDLRTTFDRFRRTSVDRVPGFEGWEPGDRGLTDVCLRYEALLRESGRVDFDDLVLLAMKAVESSAMVRRCLKARFPVLMVDEYQDLGVPLHRMVLSLAFNEGVRIFCVGDPDQSIYGFTGARPALLRELAGKQTVEPVPLTKNYRSCPQIVAASEAALGEIRGFTTDSTETGTVSIQECPGGLNDQVEYAVQSLIPALQGRGDRLGQIAVLYPTTQEGTAMENGLLPAGIPFVRLDRGAGYRRTPFTRLAEELAAWCCGGWKLGSPRLSDLVAKWRLLWSSPSESGGRRLRTSVVRFLFDNRDATGPAGAWLAAFNKSVVESALAADETIDEDELDAFKELLQVTNSSGDLAELDVGMFSGKSGSLDHLVLMNLYTAKGSEFNAVILLGMDNGRLPLWRAQTLEEQAEQRRLFFVGVSRARREVHLLYSGWTENKYGRRFHNGPTPYLVELSRLL
jgi:DNA helicase-2/ATP-dependent DNA helicase PcrA